MHTYARTHACEFVCLLLLQMFDDTYIIYIEGNKGKGGGALLCMIILPQQPVGIILNAILLPEP